MAVCSPNAAPSDIICMIDQEQKICAKMRIIQCAIIKIETLLCLMAARIQLLHNEQSCNVCKHRY